ncbi:MAG: hypothetical protein ACRD2W_17545 [Acidimicrobiales bacterium]
MQVHRWAARAAPYVRGPVGAAARFEPNVVIAAGGGLAAFNALFDERRRRKAIDAGIGIAPNSLVVVTTEEVAIFDATLLRWWGFREPAVRWSRADVVARPVPLARAYNPLRPPDADRRPWPALALEDRAGTLVAELQPSGWNATHRRVFEVLTNSDDYPSGHQLTLSAVVTMTVLMAIAFSLKAQGIEGTVRGRVITIAVLTAVIAAIGLVAYFTQD